MNIFNNRNGANSLGIAGIVITIILFEVLAGYFIYQINEDEIQNVFVSNCDCSDSTLTGLGNLVSNKLGCDVYLAQHGFNELYDKCESQIASNIVLKDAVSNRFFNMTLFTIILFALNATLILCAVLLFRGVSG